MKKRETLFFFIYKIYRIRDTYSFYKTIRFDELIDDDDDDDVFLNFISFENLTSFKIDF